MAKKHKIDRRRKNFQKNPYEMDEDDLEYLRAVDKYRRTNKIRWMKATDYLTVLKSLGWEKPEKLKNIPNLRKK